MSNNSTSRRSFRDLFGQRMLCRLSGLLTLCWFTVAAQALYAQSPVISLTLKNATVREVIEAVGVLLEPAQTREHALCCGSSVANTAISDGQQVQIARSVAAQLDATGAEVIVTACPLCKKAIGRGTKSEVRDLAEIVVAAIK
mgnify:CR=1 FL=1